MAYLWLRYLPPIARSTDTGLAQDQMSDHEALRRPHMHSSVELPPIHNHINQEPMPPFHSPRPRELLPSIMSRSPPGRSSTLPPIQKRDKPARPRKSSITKSERRPKHGRGMSKEHARRLSIEGRKALSAEPASAMGKRWEDLIEAATSANEADSDRDLTPVKPHSFPLPSSPVFNHLQLTNRDSPDPPISPIHQARLPSPLHRLRPPHPLRILQSLSPPTNPHAPTPGPRALPLRRILPRQLHLSLPHPHPVPVLRPELPHAPLRPLHPQRRHLPHLRKQRWRRERRTGSRDLLRWV